MKDLAPVLYKRLGNDVTRQTTLRALTLMANNQETLDLDLFVKEVSLGEVSSFMRKTSSALKLETAVCLEALVRTRGNKVTQKGFSVIMKEMSGHIEYEHVCLWFFWHQLASKSLFSPPYLVTEIWSLLTTSWISYRRACARIPRRARPSRARSLWL